MEIEMCDMLSGRREKSVCKITCCEPDCWITPLVYQTGLAEEQSFRITLGERNGQREQVQDWSNWLIPLHPCTNIPNKLPICVLVVLLVHVLLLNIVTWKPHTLEPATQVYELIHVGATHLRLL